MSASRINETQWLQDLFEIDVSEQPMATMIGFRAVALKHVPQTKKDCQIDSAAVYSAEDPGMSWRAYPIAKIAETFATVGSYLGESMVILVIARDLIIVSSKHTSQIARN